MNTSEARRAVNAIADAENQLEDTNLYTAETLERLGRMANNTDNDTYSATAEDIDTLKIGAFGLLVAPVTAGVKHFLEEPEAKFQPGKQYIARDIVLATGSQIYDAALSTLHEDESLEQFTGKLAALRAQHTDHPNHASMLVPFETNLLSAARSSVQSMINVALANAYALHQVKGDELSKAELITAVRNSTQLALSIPMVHMMDLTIINTNILGAHNYESGMGKDYWDNILRVNPNTNLVTNGKPIQQWNLGPVLTIADNEWKNGDVRIGCPFSFAPKEIRVDYYQAIVDLMDNHMTDVWPSPGI